jgi:hypothetical protein
MPKEFSSVVVVDENVQQVLLILRADLRIWALPGGGLEVGETREEAETREVRWFPVNGLPARIAPSVRESVADALADTTDPTQKIQRLPFWQIVYFRLWIGLRDLRNRQKGS